MIRTLDFQGMKLEAPSKRSSTFMLIILTADLDLELIFYSAGFLVWGQIRVWIYQIFTQPKISILVSKFRILGGEQSYAGLTQKFHFCENT